MLAYLDDERLIQVVQANYEDTHNHSCSTAIWQTHRSNTLIRSRVDE
jgi:hypothetical protein